MANTTNFGWETPDDTDLVKDGAAAMRTLGNSIDASFVDLKGGTTGQVLAKASNTDLDFVWSADAAGISPTIFDAKGDLIAATAADTAARLAVGANGTVLTADSSEATGLKWATPAGGKVLQVKSTTLTSTYNSTSTTYNDITNFNVQITPSATSSKILILMNDICNLERTGQTESGFVSYQLVRDTTSIYEHLNTEGFVVGGDSGNKYTAQTKTMIYLDSPSSTSAITYKVQMKAQTAGTSYGSGKGSTITVMEIGA